MSLQDALGGNLIDAFYVSPAGQVYQVKISGNTFSAENARVGFMQIKDYQDAASQLTRLSDPKEDARFILSKLETE